MRSSKSPRTIPKENVDYARDEGISSDDSSDVETDAGGTKIGGAREMSGGGKVVRSLGKDLAFQLAKSASEIVLASRVGARGKKSSRDDAAALSSDGDSSGAREVRSIINRDATSRKRASRDR